MKQSVEFRTVGRVKDAHGLKGELFITLFSQEAAWLDQLEEISLKNSADSEEHQTFKVKSARIHKNGLIVLSPDIKGRTQAEGLKGYLLDIPEDFLVSEQGENLYLSELEGFKIQLPKEGVIGEITDFSSNGWQDLLVVKTAKGEFEIPFVEDFVSEIDWQEGIIHMVLPSGLLGEEDEKELVANKPATEVPDAFLESDQD